MCDSWASADILSPQTYRDWIAPLHRRIAAALHAAGLKAVIYNTGNVLPMLDTLAALGYDALSLEERIKGVEMDIGEVRKVVGPDLCLFGNFDSYLLLAGDRQRIREEVDRQIRGAGSRAFIMGTGSPICDGTEPDTVDYWIGLGRGAYGHLMQCYAMLFKWQQRSQGSRKSAGAEGKS
jgi:uroporphyrinogen-III decarboxylase